MIKLDYSLDSPQERNELVKKILEENPDPGEKEKNHSNRIFEEMKAYVAWAGFDCSWKNDGNCFASFPDKIVKK